MSEATDKKLSRVRRPRVHITYDVETDGAVQERELPFVMGVLGDFSGNPTEKLPPLRERKFVEINRDNFDKVMASMKPGLKLRVKNVLADDGSELAVDLKFQSLADFAPGRIVEQVEPMRKLLDARNKLRDLLAKADGSADFEEKLEEILNNTEHAQKLASELGLKKGGE